LNISTKDFQKAQEAIKTAFNIIGIKLPEDTPKRYLEMLAYLTEFNNISNEEISQEVQKVFEIDVRTNSRNMVIVKDISAFSFCEHHVALIYDINVSVAYIPKKVILGLSKIVRIVDMVCRRLQLQEKIGNDIIEIIGNLTASNDVAVYISAKHSCVTSRGIKNVSTKTVTTNFKGLFEQDGQVRNSFLNSLS
jgi:GTP cyclohydrolase I